MTVTPALVLSLRTDRVITRMSRHNGPILALACLALAVAPAFAQSPPLPPAPAAASSETQAPDAVEYRLLATSRTSTMQKELNEAAEAGFRFGAFMGGSTAFGGNEVVAVMTRHAGARGRYAYKLLATSRTSTMQRELQDASDDGYEYRAQSTFENTFSGQEVVLILERDKDAEPGSYEYLLLATSKTSTMQKEMTQAGRNGYDLVGMTVGTTAMGGNEVVAITRRPRGR
jgi:hypothetical protein